MKRLHLFRALIALAVPILVIVTASRPVTAAPVIHVQGYQPLDGRDARLARLLDESSFDLFHGRRGLLTAQLFHDEESGEQGWVCTWKGRGDLDRFFNSPEFRRFTERVADGIAEESTARVLPVIDTAWRAEDAGRDRRPPHPGGDRPGQFIPRSDDESLIDFQARMEAQQRSRATVLPRGQNESGIDYQDRLDAQVVAPATILPREGTETTIEFQDRLKASATAGATIPPRAETETLIDYQSRLEAAANSDYRIHPRGPDESSIDFSERLRYLQRR